MGFNSFLKVEEFKFGAKRKGSTRSLFSSITSIIMGLIVALIIATAIGYDPFAILGGLFSIGFDNPWTLFHEFGILALAGFAFAFTSKAGVFNIGISGQMLAAATTVVLVTGVAIPEGVVANGVGQIITLLLAVGVGVFVALFTGAMEVFLKVNSVVTAILLNWIIYFISYYLLATNSPSTTDSGTIVGSAEIPTEFRFFDAATGSPILPIMITVLAIGVIIFVIFKFTTFGHKANAVGLSMDAARFSGYKVNHIKLTAFAVSGAIAGVLAIILYTSGRQAMIPLSISANTVPIEGFNGIAIALIAFNNPIGILGISALLGLFKSSVLGIFQNDSASFTNLLIGLLLLGAALSVVIIEWRPILKYKMWKFGQDISRANDRLESGLNSNVAKYRELYIQVKENIFNDSKLSNPQKQVLWEKVSKEIETDYGKEKQFINETYLVSQIYSWISHSKSKNKLNENKTKINEKISLVKNNSVKQELSKVLGGQ